MSESIPDADLVSGIFIYAESYLRLQTAIFWSILCGKTPFLKGQNYDRISTWAAPGCGWPLG